MENYELKEETILKDGHTMFLQDVVKDLNRKANLEALRVSSKEEIKKFIEKYQIQFGLCTSEQEMTIIAHIILDLESLLNHL